jgi:hypothetical protein
LHRSIAQGSELVVAECVFWTRVPAVAVWPASSMPVVGPSACNSTTVVLHCRHGRRSTPPPWKHRGSAGPRRRVAAARGGSRLNGLLAALLAKPATGSLRVDGKEGVAGSSPAEGSKERPGFAAFPGPSRSAAACVSAPGPHLGRAREVSAFAGRGLHGRSDQPGSTNWSRMAARSVSSAAFAVASRRTRSMAAPVVQPARTSGTNSATGRPRTLIRSRSPA